MTTTSFITANTDQELDLASLSAVRGAGALEWIAERAERTGAFYSGGAGAVAGGAAWDRGA